MLIELGVFGGNKFCSEWTIKLDWFFKLDVLIIHINIFSF